MPRPSPWRARRKMSSSKPPRRVDPIPPLPDPLPRVGGEGEKQKEGRCMATVASDIQVTGPVHGRQEQILTQKALGFLFELQRRFGPARDELLARRIRRQADF